MDNAQKPTQKPSEAATDQRAGAPSPSSKERKAYAKAGQEILEQNMDPACWAMAVDHADGDHELARSYYARWRAEELSDDIVETENKKVDLDSRRVHSFNRIRQTPKPNVIPAALRPSYGALYWETLITVALMCSFVPLVLRFTALEPIEALLYTLFASVSILVALRIGTRVLFKNKSGSVYRRLTASTACVLAVTSLLVGVAILKSGWDQDDFHNTEIQVVPEDRNVSSEKATSSNEAKSGTHLIVSE